MHRDGIRPRPIDDNKELRVIRNILQEKENMTPEDQSKFANLEEDIKAVIDNFNKIKSIFTPQYQNLYNKLINNNENINLKSSEKKSLKKLETQDKCQSSGSSGSSNSNTNIPNSLANNLNQNNSNNLNQINLNNNGKDNIKDSNNYKDQPVQGKFIKNNINNITNEIITARSSKKTQVIQEEGLSYTLKEFKRPDHYIVYSTKDREIRENRGYEATESAYTFLNYLENFMKIDELEKIITALENEIGHGEKISDEKAKKIIVNLYPQYENKAQVIINFFNDEREEKKKSLIRKYWRIQKNTDKHLAVTYRKRERERMKTRKNNQNKNESLNKIKENRNLCHTDIKNILDALRIKEDLKTNEARIGELLFELELEKILTEKGKNGYNAKYTKLNQGNNNPINNNDLIAFQKTRQMILNEMQEESKTILKGISSAQEFLNEKEKKIKPSEERKKPQNPPRRPGGEEKPKQTAGEEPAAVVVQEEQKVIPQKPKKREDPTLQFKNEFELMKDKYFNCKDTNESLNNLSGLNKFNNSEKKKEKISIKLRVRIASDGKKTIDRYIQKRNSMEIFDDDFNKQFDLFNYAKIDINEDNDNMLTNNYRNGIDYNNCNNSNIYNYNNKRSITYGERNNFYSFYDAYFSECKFVNNLITDFDNDPFPTSDIKNFGQKMKQFTKTKRCHP